MSARNIPTDQHLLSVETAIISRRSIRGFVDTPVERPTIERILEVASRSPSGSNMQPWKVHVLTGATLARFVDEMTAAFEADAAEHRAYEYYPSQWRQPYIDRRRKLGIDLYALAGVGRGDAAGARRQRGRNYKFFGAPVGLIVTMDDDLGQGSWIDIGAFIQTLMIAARGHGLHTCPQAIMANYPTQIRRLLDIPGNEMIITGIALGHPDPAEPTNQLVTEREPVSSFAVFHD